MPVSPTYPGVYVEEIPSGVRTITGVATSITAFIGRAKRGPVNEPMTINNFGDYERIFGGLVEYSSMSFAVRDFYLNGGARAVIVRLFKENSDEDDGKAKITIGENDELKFEAVSPGLWGNALYDPDELRISISFDVSEELAEPFGVELFNLAVTDGNITEKHMNVTVNEDSERRIDKVLAAQSDLIRWSYDNSSTPSWPSPDISGIKTLIVAVQTAETNVAAATTVNAREKIIEEQLKPAKVKLHAEYKLVHDEKGQPSGNNGQVLTGNEYTTGVGLQNKKKGLYALEKVDLFNLLCIPPDFDIKDEKVIKSNLLDPAAMYCEKRRAMLIVDPPPSWESNGKLAFSNPDVTAIVDRHKNAALFFPRLKQPNPEHDNRIEEFAPCGAVAGIIARTDTERGVWKAPAGIDATLRGVPELSVKLTDAENGQLNPLGINCLRSFPNIGRVVWGARTLDGADQNPSDWKYIPVRRLALFIEESLFRGTQWVVFEPNDEPLWAQIRMNVGAFMHTLFRQGAFQGTSPKHAYFVKCDKETNPQNDIDRGIVNIVVGFAPLKPAEFVVIKLQQIAGDLDF